MTQAGFDVLERRIEPGETLDVTGDSLARALMRRHAGHAPSLPGTLVLGLLSGGVVATWRYAQRMRRAAVPDHHQAVELAEWFRAQTPSPEADALSIAAAGMRPPVLLPKLVKLLAIAAIPLAWVVATRDLGQIFTPAVPLPELGLQAPRPITQAAILFHLVSLSGFALVAAWGWRAREGLRGFVEAFNTLARAQALPAVTFPRRPLRGAVPWWAAAVALGLAGPLWAGAMMVAGALVVGYIRDSSDVVRVQLGDALRVWAERSHPSAMVPPRPSTLARCRRSGCGATLPSGARFCPRCGQPAAGPAT
jgi:hypothetical protein